MNKLQTLAEIEGYEDPIDMLEKYHIENVVPCICSNPDCDATDNLEPDSTQGWCSQCQANTMVSCLILAGII